MNKKLYNIYRKGQCEIILIKSKIQFSLEECMEYIQKDELLEITPKALRMRKIYLEENERMRMSKKSEEMA